HACARRFSQQLLVDGNFPPVKYDIATKQPAFVNSVHDQMLQGFVAVFRHEEHADADVAFHKAFCVDATLGEELCEEVVWEFNPNTHSVASSLCVVPSTMCVAGGSSKQFRQNVQPRYRSQS